MGHDCAECEGRRSRRFSVRNESRSGTSLVLSLRAVKRAKARAPFLISTWGGMGRHRVDDPCAFKRTDGLALRMIDTPKGTAILQDIARNPIQKGPVYVGVNCDNCSEWRQALSSPRRLYPD